MSGADRSHRVAFSMLLKYGSVPALSSRDSLHYPFAVLSNLFRIVASEWNVVNAYLKAELLAIEWNLENMSVGIGDLEMYRRALFVYRRRISGYERLAAEQHALLGAFGRRAWLPPDVLEAGGIYSNGDDVVRRLPPEVRRAHADLVADFASVRALLADNAARVEKNIALIGMLLTLQEWGVARVSSRAVTVLTFVGVVSIPFGTVASILDIGGDGGAAGGSSGTTGDGTDNISRANPGYGPGQDSFWVFWVASIIVVACIAAAYVVHTGPLSQWQASRLPKHQLWEHYIDETGDAKFDSRVGKGGHGRTRKRTGFRKRFLGWNDAP